MTKLLCLLIGGLLSTAAALSHADSFRLGVAPHTSARKIVEMYQPLRLHLEKVLGQPVDIVTAPDFTEFARRAVAQEYDIAVTTGHQARLLQVDAKYIPLVTYQAEFRAVALVAGNSKIQKPADLKGQKVLGLSPTSLVTLWGQHWLKNNRVNTVPMEYISASDSVAKQLVSGQAAVGFTSLANYQQFPTAIQSQLRFLAMSDPLAGRVYMLNARDRQLQAKLDEALFAFADSDDGKRYFVQYKLDGYRKLKPRELDAMDPFAAEVRRELATSKGSN